MRSSYSKWSDYRKKRNGPDNGNDGNDGNDLADTRLALIVLVLSAAVLVIVIERFACMASTRLALRPINCRSPTRGSCSFSPSAYPLPNSCPSIALTGME